ncbi:hypothetical protein MSHOH_2724 [Methanosarcina horonobensis HB-1 = JCM 15518]|uniref:Uncharacterized protein n=1 Tax=Methanosarcina horonobensis HB-1 = JCM 15518 TaxID=1434110 RepID=A0A0E3SG06_9EURY|nr:hypothetical protein MSHOH_2724 [Methanosarcina horonobensis HB-1 = JCM 15518]
MGADMFGFKFKSPYVPALCFRFSPKLEKDNSLVAERINMSEIKLQGFIKILKSGFLPSNEISKNSGKEIGLNLLFSFFQEGDGFQKHVFFPEHSL